MVTDITGLGIRYQHQQEQPVMQLGSQHPGTTRAKATFWPQTQTRLSRHDDLTLLPGVGLRSV